MVVDGERMCWHDVLMTFRNQNQPCGCCRTLTATAKNRTSFSVGLSESQRPPLIVCPVSLFERFNHASTDMVSTTSRAGQGRTGQDIIELPPCLLELGAVRAMPWIGVK